MNIMTNRNKVEAILFASGRLMSLQQICDLTELKPKQVKEAIAQLTKEYSEKETSLGIFEQDGKWKVNVTEKYIPLVKKIVAETELERPVLETLAVIAYRSPVLQSDVIKARGSGAYEHIKELVEKGFITKEKYARSFKLKISDKFFNYFDVEGDADIREIFKGIKMPEPKIPKKIGSLDVVAAESDEDHEKHRKQMQLEIYTIKEAREKDKDYLNEFDKRLDEVKIKINDDVAAIEEQKKKIPESKKESDNSKEDEKTDEEELKDDSPPDYANDPERLVADIDKQIEEMTKNDKSNEEESNKNI